MLSAIRESDRNVVPYTRSARVWSTVTPVAPPGFDDPDGLRNKLNHAARTAPIATPTNRKASGNGSIGGPSSGSEKAFRQAGLPNELIGAAELEYREVGFRPASLWPAATICRR